MHSTGLLSCCLLLALVIAGARAPLVAADLGKPPRADTDDRAPTERKVAEYCQGQLHICRKICYLNARFRDRINGCSHVCDSRAIRCTRTGCYRWTEPDFTLAVKFGAHRCIE
jgi:hypothetical protein